MDRFGNTMGRLIADASEFLVGKADRTGVVDAVIGLNGDLGEQYLNLEGSGLNQKEREMEALRRAGTGQVAGFLLGKKLGDTTRSTNLPGHLGHIAPHAAEFGGEQLGERLRDLAFTNPYYR